MRKSSALLLCLTSSLMLLDTATASAQAPVPLATTQSFALLAGSGITNTGATTIAGDVGSFPTLAQTGFGSVTLTGTNHAGNAVTQGAKIDLRTAFVDAAGRPGATPIAGGTLGGRLLTPGVYKDNGAPGSLGLTGTLTLDFQGDPNAVFIFQSASTLITEVDSRVVPINLGGGTGCNVFWQVGSAATLKTRSQFIGTIMAYDDISLQANATVAGRLLAGAQAGGAGAITLINNTITPTICAAPPPPPPVVQYPDLIIAKSHSGNFQGGGVGVYTLMVTNVGDAWTNGEVTVRDTLPSGLTATAISGAGWSCTLSSASCSRSDALGPVGSYQPISLTVNVANNPLVGGTSGSGLTFQRGDILLSMKDGTVQWRRRDWTLVRTLTNSTDGQAKGMAFDASGNLYLTHYYGTNGSGNDVVKFDPIGNFLGLFGSGYDCNPSSIVFDTAGNAYVGQADCSGDILKLGPNGNRLDQYNVTKENRGSSHILLDPDQCTMYYTSQGAYVKRYNVCTHTQLSDFNSTPLPDAVGGAFEMALLPDGGMLVANFSVIVRLDASGNLVRTFDAPAETHCWLGIAPDTDGVSFWATNWCGSSVTRFDLANGNVIEGHVASDTEFMVKQIIVVSGPPIVVAPPSSFVVINTAVVSGGGEVNLSNDSASDSTTIISQTQTPALSIASAFCVGTSWSLGVDSAFSNATVNLMGTSNGQSWTIAEWGMTQTNGRFTQGGAFGDGAQGTHTLKVEIGGKTSNSVAFVVSDCRP